VGEQTGKTIVIDFSPEALSGDVMVSGNNTCGPGMASSKSVYVYTCPGMEENRLSKAVLLFPNPAAELLNVTFLMKMQQSSLQLSDISGRKILTKIVRDSYPGFTERINVAEIPAGVYFLRLISGNSVLTGKVVIRKE
jgi:hypothetical protein